MKISLIANAGLLIKINGKTFLIDAVHRECAPPFCAVPLELLEYMIAGAGDFEHIDALMFTHNHKDHYDKQCADLFLKNHKETALIFPSLEKDACDISKYNLGNIKIEAKKTPHEGEQYKNVINYSFYIYNELTSIFISGDAAIESEPLVSFLNGRKTYAAALCFPFLTLSKGRKIIDLINPDVVIAYHLPFENEDNNNYIKSCERVIKNNELSCDIKILCGYNQTIEI